MHSMSDSTSVPGLMSEALRSYFRLLGRYPSTTMLCFEALPLVREEMQFLSIFLGTLQTGIRIKRVCS
jgi:hypothetical protein